ncbi:MAG: DUF2155 domain-containing protein [Alphaproteobacteria bacterium]|nr:DUF2155 domain-containing protein [Alphaproteobacteria bacterium]
MKKTTLVICSSLICLNLATSAQAENIEKNTARMQAMDKITGRVSMINVPVNGEVKFGSLSIVVRSCQTRPAEETPDNFAFVDITDTSPKKDTLNIFKGWMISSSPATHALEHPIYDVWLLQCIDEENKNAIILTQEQLAERDTIPMQQLPPLKTAQNADLQTAEDKIENKQKPIAEMTEETKPETAEPEMLISTEFSFDEDEETTAPLTADEDISAEELPADAISAPDNMTSTAENNESTASESDKL